MKVLVVQCFVEIQATDKTPITLQKRNSTMRRFDKFSKIVQEWLPTYNITRNNLITKSTRWLQVWQSSSKPLKNILLENLTFFGAAIFRTSSEK